MTERDGPVVDLLQILILTEWFHPAPNSSIYVEIINGDSGKMAYGTWYLWERTRQAYHQAFGRMPLILR